MEFYEVFPHSFSVEISPDLPSDAEGRVHQFSPPEGSPRASMLIRVSAYNHYTWWGIFRGDYPSAKWGVFTCPSECHLSVIVAGCGYIVDSTNPTSWEAIAAYPVVEVFPVVERWLLLFLDFSEIIAYGVRGFEWRTGDMGFDGFAVVGQSGDFLILEGYREGRVCRIEIDLGSGKVLGADLV